MIYLKSLLAGIAGSVLALTTLLVVVIIVTRIVNISATGTVWAKIIPFLPLTTVVLGFVIGFHLMYRKLMFQK